MHNLKILYLMCTSIVNKHEKNNIFNLLGVEMDREKVQANTKLGTVLTNSSSLPKQNRNILFSFATGWEVFKKEHKYITTKAAIYM